MAIMTSNRTDAHIPNQTMRSRTKSGATSPSARGSRRNGGGYS